MYQIKEEKNALRKIYAEKRENIDWEKKQKLDKKIVDRFMTLATYRYAHTLLMYYPLKNEIDIRELIEKALAAGKRVALPRCEANTSTMHFHYISSLDELVPGRFGIMEPSTDAELFTLDSLCGPCTVIIPALAYDKSGYRLGYGKGFYDRYFSTPAVSSVGLIYSDFLVDKLPHGRYDIAVDLLVSEKEVKIVGKEI
jgi:5-formyltetrahydrofolate cyclo-ligase